MKTIYKSLLWMALLLGAGSATAQVQYLFGYYDPTNNITYYLATNDDYTEVITTTSYDEAHCLWTASWTFVGTSKRNVYQKHGNTYTYLYVDASGLKLRNGPQYTNWIARDNFLYDVSAARYLYFNTTTHTMELTSSTTAITRIRPMSENILTSQSVWSRAGDRIDPNDPNSAFSNSLSFNCAAGNHTSVIQQFTVYNTEPDYLVSLVVPGNAPYRISKDRIHWYSSLGLIGNAEDIVYVRMVGQDEEGNDYAEGSYNGVELIMPVWPGVTLHSITLNGVIGPDLNVEPAEVTGFFYPRDVVDYPRRARTFSVYGGALDNPVSITANGEFEISLDRNGTYGSSLTITPDEHGDVDTTTIYVKLKPNLETGVYEGLVRVSYSETVEDEVHTINRVVRTAGRVYEHLFGTYPSEVTGLHYDDEGPSDAAEIHVDACNIGTTLTATLKSNHYFEIAAAIDGTYGDALTLTDAASLISRKIYVRLKNDLVPGSFFDTIVFTIGDEVLKLPVSGSVSKLNTGIYDDRKLVVLKDLEDHKWTYYSGVDESVDGGHYNTEYLGTIYRPNPRNVSIYYLGGGVEDASPVAVSAAPGEGQNEFHYHLTLDEGQPPGQYPYTVIPNPFSKRPRANSHSGDTDGFYGFGGWRIVSSHGHILNHSDGDILGLEEEIALVNLSEPTDSNAIATIIELEATWVPATVRISKWRPAANEFKTGTYETNFWVINDDIDALDTTDVQESGRLAKLDKAMTMSMKMPDGTDLIVDGQPVYGNKKIYAHRDIFAVQVDSLGRVEEYTHPNMALSVTTNLNGGPEKAVKLEWLTMDLDSSNYISAGGRNLILGRGIVNRPEETEGNRCWVIGVHAVHEVKQTIRVESGQYSHFRHFVNNTAAGKLKKQHVIFGCDYDRAKEDNSKLLFTNTMKVGECGFKDFYQRDPGFRKTSITIPTNHGDTVCCVWGKSGRFITNVPTTDGASDENYYLHSASRLCKGFRYLEIQGGEWKGISGGQSDTTDSNAPAFMLRIKGGVIHDVIYGGATRSPAGGIITFVITGGTIKGWVAAGSNCNTANNNQGALTGRTYVYVGGNASINSENSPRIINHAVGGNVFGAGCGLGPTSQSGRVDFGTNVVIADNAYVERGVYGGGAFGYCATDKTSHIYITGGQVNAFPGAYNTLTGAYHDGYYDGSIQGGVFGGSSLNKGGSSRIIMTGGQVNGGIYGGSNHKGTMSGSTSIKVLGGQVGSVYEDGRIIGGGYGSETVVNGDATIKVGGDAMVYGNIYGGSYAGRIDGNTSVTFGDSLSSAVEVSNIYGAGFGSESDVKGDVSVLVKNGHVRQNVYGGGEMGIVNNSEDAHNAERRITVTMDDGNVGGNIFGGGSMGASYATTTLNMNGGTVHGNLFAGAEGSQASTIFVSGLRTLNMTGGEVYGSVYGGSCNASDGDRIVKEGEAMPSESEDFSHYTSFVNVSGGNVRTHVYGAGFYGEMFGSSDVNVGKTAIESANPANNINRNPSTSINTPLVLNGSVYAGANWGDFSVGEGFTTNTTKGFAHVYVDGTGYDNTITDLGLFTGSYINIGQGIYGSGTSCYAGKLGNNIYVRNYGLPERHIIQDAAANNGEPYEALMNASRSLTSIQQCDSLIFDNANIVFYGEGDMTSNNPTIQYCIRSVSKAVVLGNSSSLVINNRVEEMHELMSVKIENFYTTRDLTTILLQPSGDGTNTFTHSTENTIRINDGYAVKVRWREHGNFNYGPVTGFLRIATPRGYNSFAYARPKTSALNSTDGGFLCYHDASHHNEFQDPEIPTTLPTNLLQHPYINSIDSNSIPTSWRVWRFSPYPYENSTTLPIALTAAVSTTDASPLLQATATLMLPAYTGSGDSTLLVISDVDFGDQITLVDAAFFHPENATSRYIYYDEDSYNSYITDAQNAVINEEFQYIDEHPNTSFGLAVLPGGNTNADSVYIISHSTVYDEHDLDMIATNIPGVVPELTFLLTYSNNISTNTTLSPITLFVHRYEYDWDNNVRGALIDEMVVPIYITTLTELGQNIELSTYALYGKVAYDNPNQSFKVKAIVPTFDKPNDADGYYFGVRSVTYEGQPYNLSGSPTGTTANITAINPMPANDVQFGMTVRQALNADLQNGWLETEPYYSAEHDATQISPRYPYLIGHSDGRKIASIDFNLWYNSFTLGSGVQYMEDGLVGTFRFTMVYSTSPTLDVSSGGEYTIAVHVYKKSDGSKFYLDGLYGNDRMYSGRFPNAAKRTLQGIFDAGYMTSDTIIVVYPVTINNHNSLTWSNENFYNQLVTLYRYSGEHPLSTNPNDGHNRTEHALAQNKRPLVEIVSGSMVMHGIVLDGLSEYDGVEDITLNPHGLEISPEAPLVVVRTGNATNGGSFEMTNGTVLRNNFNKKASTNTNTTASENTVFRGGGVYVDANSSMTIRDGSKISRNKVLASKSSHQEGAGIFLDGGSATVKINGLVTINDNEKVYEEGSLRIKVANNVYMKDRTNNIFIDRTNDQHPIEEGTCIGITTSDLGFWEGIRDYAPLIICNAPEHLQDIFSRHFNLYGDLDIYELFHSTEAPFDPSIIYIRRRK